MIELAPLRKARLKARAGYTLVEILIVLAIIALIVFIAARVRR